MIQALARATLPAVVAFAVLLTLGGCASDPTRGYVWGGTYNQDVSSVAVPIFTNETFERGIHTELTEAIIKEIERVTPWDIGVQGATSTVVNGVVTDVSLRRLARDRDTGLVQELAVVLTVSFEWVDERTGEVLVSRRGLRVGESFVPARGANEPIEVGRAAAVQEAAREIVALLRSSW